MDVSSDDDKTHAMIFDVQIVENEYYDENVANGNNGVNVIDANVDEDPLLRLRGSIARSSA